MRNCVMSSGSRPSTQDVDQLEAAVDEAIAACGGDVRSTIRALIVANNFLESEVSELKKAVSHAYLLCPFGCFDDHRCSGYRACLEGIRRTAARLGF